VFEVKDISPSHVLYNVRDLQRCPQCGATGHHPDEAFCPSCGALMDQKPIAIMLQQPASLGEIPTDIAPEDHLVKDEQNYWIWRETQEGGAMSTEMPLMRMTVGIQSDTGQVRELDEDSVFSLTMSCTYESVTHQLGLFVVADGMGGHKGGEVASRVAIQTTAQILLRDLFGPELTGSALSTEAILDCLTDAISQANDEVYLERQKRENDMGTTLTAAFVKDWTLHLGHVGDCRAYLWGEEGLQQLTEDHSIVAGMVAAGTILPEDIYTHPQRSVIYRCIGDEPTVEVDVGTLQLDPGERIVVCCDGLWEELRDTGIEDILLAEADPQTACDLMVHQANLAGGSDNISVIIVQF
jgi:protein phosphatase